MYLFLCQLASTENLLPLACPPPLAFRFGRAREQRTCKLLSREGRSGTQRDEQGAERSVKQFCMIRSDKQDAKPSDTCVRRASSPRKG
eukprot:6191107-Pleurochrysis_carterae.AAC.1